MNKRSGGFTLIEVVLVLAIAGLLLVVVFAAMSGAQKSRHDAQRKNDLARVVGLLNTYAGNNSGQFPSTAEVDDMASSFRTSYDTLNMVDPVSGQHYVFSPDFGPCDSGAPYDNRGPGFISYKLVPSGNQPYTLRMCLSKGEYYVTQ